MGASQRAHVAELADALDSGFHFWSFFPVAYHRLEQRQNHWLYWSQSAFGLSVQWLIKCLEKDATLAQKLAHGLKHRFTYQLRFLLINSITLRRRPPLERCIVIFVRKLYTR